MRNRRRSLPALCLLLVAACGTDQPREEVAAEFADAFVQGDVDAMADLAAPDTDLTAVEWQAGFLATLGLDVDTSSCAATEDPVYRCDVRGDTRMTELLVGGPAEFALVLWFDGDRIDHARYEAGPATAGFAEFMGWVQENHGDVFAPAGACGDLEGPSDPAPCATASVELLEAYLAG